jgi:hypothetical protein
VKQLLHRLLLGRHGPHREVVVAVLEHLPGVAALVVALEAVDDVLAAGVVRRDDEDVLVALVVDVLAGRLGVAVAHPGHREEVRIALLAGEVRRAGVRADVEGLRLEHRLLDGLQQVLEHDAGHQVDLVALEHLVGELARDVGLLLVVLDDHLDRQAAQLAAGVLDAEQESVADRHADDAAGAGERADEADLDPVGGEGRGRERGGEREADERLLHGIPCGRGCVGGCGSGGCGRGASPAERPQRRARAGREERIV